jgi:hypothetical protein
MGYRPITDTLRHLRGGQLIDECSEALAGVVQAVDATGKSGKLTIELTIKKISRSGALDIVDKVTARAPEDQPLSTLMFPTPEGNLLTEDPRQQKLELRPVAVPTADSLIGQGTSAPATKTA